MVTVNTEIIIGLNMNRTCTINTTRRMMTMKWIPWKICNNWHDGGGMRIYMRASMKIGTVITNRGGWYLWF